MESNEQTPLIATVYVPAPRRRGFCRRFISVACGSSVVALFLFLLLPAAFVHRIRYGFGSGHWPPFGNGGDGGSYRELQNILLETPTAEMAEAWSRYYTSGPHLAGKNYSQAVWTMDRWKEFGIEQTGITEYETYLNYPSGHRLVLYEKGGDGGGDTRDDASEVDMARPWKVRFEARLEEDIVDQDPTSGLEDRIPTFHGYSANGNVTAQYVYANYGTYQDFEDLVKANISLQGKIAIVRYGMIFRGLKTKRAQELGMVGIIMFSDPGDDGAHTEMAGDASYPDGPARNPSSVQRGSTQFLSFLPGDPTTPGYPSKPGVPRLPVDRAIPSIPSLPISYADAIPILKSLNGHGPRASDFNEWWTRSVGLEYKGVNYNIGPSPDNLKLHLVNEQEYVTTPIWNVIGIINGTLQDEVVVVGNHRDAWIAGGAGDPNSATAALTEVIRGFGKALQRGWKPLRTIVFASWDGEEYALLGSTEWVEEYLPWLTDANVAYVNIDVGVTGPEWTVSSSPLLDNIMYEVTGLVASPNQTIEGQTIRDVWNGRISTMGSGSDFTAFQDFAGIPSVDMGFRPKHDSPVYQYHSNYDSFYWMSRYGDPGFRYHVAAARILGLFVAKLAETPVLPLNTTDYAKALKNYIAQVESKIDGSKVQTGDRGSGQEVDAEEARSRLTPPVTGHNSVMESSLRETFGRLNHAAKVLHLTATKFDTHAAQLAAEAAELPWWRWFSWWRLRHRIQTVNRKLKFLERQFLYAEGLDGRDWFKHIVFAPGLWTGYSGAVFPSLTESIDVKDYANAKKWAQIIEMALQKAEESLRLE